MFGEIISTLFQLLITSDFMAAILDFAWEKKDENPTIQIEDTKIDCAKIVTFLGFKINQNLT